MQLVVNFRQTKKLRLLRWERRFGLVKLHLRPVNQTDTPLKISITSKQMSCHNGKPEQLNLKWRFEPDDKHVYFCCWVRIFNNLLLSGASPPADCTVCHFWHLRGGVCPSTLILSGFIGISSSSMSLRWQKSSSPVNQPCHWRRAARLSSLSFLTWSVKKLCKNIFRN